MKIYLVGGAVRDQILGVEPRDRDYLVVGATVQEMLSKGFKQVGASYEVFIHPVTKAEYVLADDLYDDLKRRDLTINSMAIDEEGNVIDPFGGKSDLENKILQHTSENFSDDSLRIYRLARFKSQWPDFKIFPATVELARSLAQTKSFKELHGNRVFSELRIALESVAPSQFFETLKVLNAKDILFKDISYWEHIDHFVPDPALRFAALLMFLNPDSINALCEELYVPSEWIMKSRAAALTREFLELKNLEAEKIVQYFYSIDVFRKPELIHFLSQLFGEKFIKLREAFFLVKDVKSTDAQLQGREISDEIRRKRVLLLKNSH